MVPSDALWKNKWNGEGMDAAAVGDHIGRFTNQLFAMNNNDWREQHCRTWVPRNEIKEI